MYKTRAFFSIILLFFTIPVFCTIKRIVMVPLLDELLEDIKQYKFDSQGDPYLHAGDLYEHLIWTHNGMIELLESDLPYVQNLNLTNRQKEIVVLAALLHDIGKAGRKELFDHTHAKLYYDIIKDQKGAVNCITYYQDCQEHCCVCFDYAAGLKNYYLIDKQGNLKEYKLSALYDQLGINEQEQKVIAILLGIHYEFGNFKHKKITAEQFLALLQQLVTRTDYNSGHIDEQILRLAILIQVADVKGLIPVTAQRTALFPDGVTCQPVHYPIKFANPFVDLGYVNPDSSQPSLGALAMQELLDCYHNAMPASLSDLASVPLV